MTFTNKAANEMKHRVQALIKRYHPEASTNEVDFPHLGTFHSICAKILRKYISRVKPHLKNSFTILDASDQHSIISDICKKSENRIIRQYFLKEKSIEKKLHPNTVCHQMSGAKNRELSAEEYLEEVEKKASKHPDNKEKLVVAHIFIEYERFLSLNNMVDFDDLLVFTCELFKNCPEVLHTYSEQCISLLVDEFQDTNTLQYKIAKGLSSKRRNMFVVGDVDQNIYTWRYSDCSIMQKISQEYPNVKVVLLNENYRSTQNILALSDEIISQNSGRIQEKKLVTANNVGIPTCLAAYGSSDEEAMEVANEITNLIRKSNGQLRFSDFAVLIRINSSSRAFEQAFVKKGIKYRILGCFKFFDRMEVKDLLAYARMVDNTDDDMAFMRCINVPKRGIGESSITNILKAAKDQKISAYELIRQVCKEKKKVTGVQAKKGFKEFVDLIEKLKQTPDAKSVFENIVSLIEYKKYLQDYEKSTWETRWENVQELLNISAEFTLKEKTDNSLTTFLHNMSLTPDNFNEGETDNNNVATISTIHSAKGLEFGFVFVTGVENGTIPFYKAEELPQIEEERRLLFVACTRAQFGLSITYCSSRFKGGSDRSCELSSFISPIIKKKKPFIQTRSMTSLVGQYANEWKLTLQSHATRIQPKQLQSTVALPSSQEVIDIDDDEVEEVFISPSKRKNNNSGGTRQKKTKY